MEEAFISTLASLEIEPLKSRIVYRLHSLHGRDSVELQAALNGGQFFYTMKTLSLHVPLICHRRKQWRIAHVFLCILAHYVTYHLPGHWRRYCLRRMIQKGNRRSATV